MANNKIVYDITAWCDRTFFACFTVEAESPEEALTIAKRQAYDEPAEDCEEDYRWDRFRVETEHGDTVLEYQTPRRTDWQPISTAPKDGTSVLVANPDYNPCSAWWDDHHKQWVIARRGITPGVGTVIALTVEPTHWMPLPSPPTETQGFDVLQNDLGTKGMNL